MAVYIEMRSNEVKRKLANERIYRVGRLAKNAELLAKIRLIDVRYETPFPAICNGKYSCISPFNYSPPIPLANGIEIFKTGVGHIKTTATYTIVPFTRVYMLSVNEFQRDFLIF
jgi:hypothetical protein